MKSDYGTAYRRDEKGVFRREAPQTEDEESVSDFVVDSVLYLDNLGITISGKHEIPGMFFGDTPVKIIRNGNTVQYFN